MLAVGVWWREMTEEEKRALRTAYANTKLNIQEIVLHSQTPEQHLELCTKPGVFQVQIVFVEGGFPFRFLLENPEVPPHIRLWGGALEELCSDGTVKRFLPSE